MASDVESFDEGKMSPCEIALKTCKQKRTKRNEPEIDNGTDSVVCERPGKQYSMEMPTNGRQKRKKISVEEAPVTPTVTTLE